MMMTLLLAAATAITPTKPDVTPPPKPDVARIPSQNPFDAHRQAWLPPTAPSAPALTDADLRIHGVILAGGTRKAIVELLAGRLIPAGPNGKPGRPFRVVTVGDEIGGYRIADITPTQLVFAQGNGQAVLPFTIAKGRAMAGGAVPNPDQVAVVTATPMPTMLEGVAPPPEDTTPAAATAPTAPVLPTSVADSGPSPAPVATPNDAVNGNNGMPSSGMSLLEAIQYAKRQAANNAASGSVQGNPFTNPQTGTGK
jgi:hypothetical protein